MEEMRMITERNLEEVANQEEEDIENQKKQKKQRNLRNLRGVKQREEKVKEDCIENKIITVLFL